MKKEFYINNSRDISKLVWVLLFSSMIISGYLVQRSFEWNSNIENKIIGFEEDPDYPLTLEDVISENLTMQQGSRLGLKINYGTLTILWPLILLGLFFGTHLFLEKLQTNLNELENEYPEFELFPLTLHASSLYFNKKSHQILIFGILLIFFPILGLLFHGYSGYFMIDLIEQALQNWISNLGGMHGVSLEDSIIPDLKYIFGIQILLSFLALFITIWLNTKSIKILKSFADIGHKT